MKRINLSALAILLIAAMLLTFVSCADNGEKSADATTAADTEPVQPEVGMIYTFSGEEAERAGYAEGSVSYIPSEPASAGDYELYFGNENGILENYYPLSQMTAESECDYMEFFVGENIAIPAKADRVILAKKEEDKLTEVDSVSIPDNKRYNAEPKMIFASVSDVHNQYTAGEQYWMNALNEYEKLGAKYVIISGDATNDGKQFLLLKFATRDSDFTGLVFMCLGNHEQTADGRKNFRNMAIYDGLTKTWIALPDAPDYFENQYTGDLDVDIFYEDIETATFTPEDSETEEAFGTNYYFATIGDNLYFFMDLMLYTYISVPEQDCFSDTQLDLLESVFNDYSGTHEVGTDGKYGTFKYEKYNLNVVEHALIQNFGAGDVYNGLYDLPIKLSEEFPRNIRFGKFLTEYTEGLMMTGHTHIGFGNGVDFLDKQYSDDGTVGNEPMIRSIHNSSTASARWIEGESLVSEDAYAGASEGYLCYEYEDDIVYEGRCFRERSPGKISLEDVEYIDKVFSVATFIMPRFTQNHD